jgi:hypothetical protein
MSVKVVESRLHSECTVIGRTIKRRLAWWNEMGGDLRAAVLFVIGIARFIAIVR